MVQAELDLVYNLNWKSSTHVIHYVAIGYNSSAIAERLYADVKLD